MKTKFYHNIWMKKVHPFGPGTETLWKNHQYSPKFYHNINAIWMKVQQKVHPFLDRNKVPCVKTSTQNTDAISTKKGTILTGTKLLCVANMVVCMDVLAQKIICQFGWILDECNVDSGIESIWFNMQASITVAENCVNCACVGQPCFMVSMPKTVSAWFRVTKACWRSSNCHIMAE